MKIITFFKRIFAPAPEQPEESFEYGQKCLLSFAINRYQQSPLRGCINDQKNIWAKIQQLWPEFKARLFQDYKCTRAKFEAEIRAAFAVMKTGLLVIQYSGHGTFTKDPSEIDGYSEALYLYDGAYSDDRLYKLMLEKPAGLKVVFILDCCFSTGITNPRARARAISQTYKQPRYLASEPMPEHFTVTRQITNEPLDWVVFAACGERETANDARINNEDTGAYSFYFVKVMRRDVFYHNWQKDVEKYLPSADFRQTPSLGGKQELVNEIVFEI